MTNLEHLWAGWRHDYVVGASAVERQGHEEPCVFCRLVESGEPSAHNGVVWRGREVFAVLNLYPYTSGHLLIVPNRHLGDLAELSGSESSELWAATQAAVAALQAAYDPDGANVGANLGRAAGAGIPRHLHFHVLPRWSGDTNFMTSVAGARVISETLAAAWEKLHPAWPAS
jgi:diadenosine tetraphosphate (Ap4A) HIT family hydrolase